MRYWFEKDNDCKLPPGSYSQSIFDLVKMRTQGGVTALMNASEAKNWQNVFTLLELGSEPLAVDCLGRMAIDYAK